MFLLSSRADIFVAQNSTGYRDGDTVLDCLTSVVPRNDISCIFDEELPMAISCMFLHIRNFVSAINCTPEHARHMFLMLDMQVKPSRKRSFRE